MQKDSNSLQNYIDRSGYKIADFTKFLQELGCEFVKIEDLRVIILGMKTPFIHSIYKNDAGSIIVAGFIAPDDKRLSLVGDVRQIRFYFPVEGIEL